MKFNLPDFEEFDPEGFFMSRLHQAGRIMGFDFEFVDQMDFPGQILVRSRKLTDSGNPCPEATLKDGFFDGLAFALNALTGREFRFEMVAGPGDPKRFLVCPHNLSHEKTFSRYSRSNIPILIHGASGTGKTFLARYLHLLSGRRGAVVELHLEAIPESLVELELFGAMKGAFTDAGEDRTGKIAAANGGTLIIENVENLGKSVQGKIGEFLGNYQFHPLGSNEAQKVNCLVICTSRFDPARLLELDLVLPSFLYRINALPVMLAPLSMRSEDQKFFFDLAVSESGHSRLDTGLFQEFISSRTDNPWPGNIPQFMNAVKAWLLGEGNDASGELQVDLKKLVEDYKRSLIHDILQQNKGNRTKTARMLGIQRTYLVKLIRDFRIETTNSTGE